MRAELKHLHSPDIEDLKSYRPRIDDDFGFLLQMMVGPEGDAGEESFDILVCTPEWIKHRHKIDDLVLGRHFLIVFEYEYNRLLRFLQESCGQCSGETWEEVANKVGRIGKWEFEDYVKGQKDV